ncbi:MAG: helix-turn-helix domain-containing protein [Deltaproteobacteria bacterium]|nr:helix-turn-helix domain-containing protein [Deltaproteobacteria bacterium]
MRNESDFYYTVSELAAELKVNPATVRRWISANQIEFVRLGPGKTVRIPRTAHSQHKEAAAEVAK